MSNTNTNCIRHTNLLTGIAVVGGCQEYVGIGWAQFFTGAEPYTFYNIYI